MSSQRSIDLNIWKPVGEPFSDGFQPHIHRTYRLETCGGVIMVQLTKQHPTLPKWYECHTPISLHLHLKPDWVKLDRLTEYRDLHEAVREAM